MSIPSYIVTVNDNLSGNDFLVEAFSTQLSHTGLPFAARAACNKISSSSSPSTTTSFDGKSPSPACGRCCCVASGAPPRLIGYDIVYREGKRDIVVNARGKLLKKAFYWKAKEKLSSEEIRRKLAGSGMKISSQKLSEVLRNPFYCGLMVHNLLNGQIVAGRHEKLISEELFLEVNGIMSQNTQGYSTNPENEHIPLKRFLKCEQCSQYLRAYKAWKNQQYYYKCNTPGCKCNKRADELHQRFRNILSSYTLLLDEDTAWAAKGISAITKAGRSCNFYSSPKGYFTTAKMRGVEPKG